MIESCPLCPLCGKSHEVSSSLCISCGAPLCPSEISAGVDYHFACAFCQFCKEPINEQVIAGIRRTERPFSHLHCWQTHNQAEIAKRPVTIDQGTFDYINAFRLMFEAKLDLEVETNQKDAEIQIDAFRRIHQMSYEEIFKFGKRLEAGAAWCMLVLDKVKKKDLLELQKKDVALIEANAARRQSDQRKKEEKTLNKLPDIRALKALGMTTQEAEMVILKEKAIQAKMAVGMTRTQAEASIQAGDQVQ